MISNKLAITTGLLLVFAIIVATSILVIILSGQSSSAEKLGEIVLTESGRVRGCQQYTLFHNKPYYAFKGIRYAKPPLGKLKLKVSHHV